MSNFLEPVLRGMHGLRRVRAWLPLAAVVLLGGQALAQDRFPGVGRAATPKEVAAWDIDVRPDFKGLPPGSGSVDKGRISGKPSAPAATVCSVNPTRCSTR